MCRTLCLKLLCPWTLWFKLKKARELRLEFGARCSSLHLCPHCLFLTVHVFFGLRKRVRELFAADKTLRNLPLEADHPRDGLFVLSHFTRGLFGLSQKSPGSFGLNLAPGALLGTFVPIACF